MLVDQRLYCWDLILGAAGSNGRRGNKGMAQGSEREVSKYPNMEVLQRKCYTHDGSWDLVPSQLDTSTLSILDRAIRNMLLNSARETRITPRTNSHRVQESMYIYTHIHSTYIEPKLGT